ncbi:protein required for attachment to host cells [Virgibacillus natechei]|uniref:Protein required for attachment to host cells n=1 Tax=Virgibacillus natechei TaxID=1216297 RepID=A0ABS4IEW9_9BACI|nr:VLRF1 family aeRF1-type release factor [Virgibacillus natechei]MBP1969490.1 protein required for attachment to host cells [Virgibacillus natechei]UZD11806.1 VLRF1 family aeRF1-type release factor [Virgibacillus natechei]
MDLNKQIQKLETIRNDNSNKVFTMYLNTDLSDPEQQGGEWKIHLKNGLRNFEQYLKEDDDKEELKNFQAVKEKVERFVVGNEQKFLKGIVLFATADEEVWFATRVQIPLETAFNWQETPHLEQLKQLSVDYPKTGIILIQQNEVKVIDSYLNEIEDTFSYELDLDTDDWREKTTTDTGSGSTNQHTEKFEDRVEANQQRWYKKIAPKLDKQAKDKSWENIYVIGESDPANELKEQMNKPVNEVIQKNMLDHEESKVLQEVFG